MNLKINFLLLAILISGISAGYADSFGQRNEDKSVSAAQTEIIYHDGHDFSVYGRFHDEKNFNRLPAKYETIVRPEVWTLGRNSAGISISFITNSPVIKIKWALLNNTTLANMAKIGVGGVDLYCLADGKWEYVSSGVPYGKVNESTLISGMDTTYKDFLIYLPLYDGIDSLEIGIGEGYSISSEIKSNDEFRPVVFYGTSITQGGCASRPGMAYTTIISRHLGVEVINLGFSGNGRLEQSVGQVICSIDASLVVIDCLPNSPVDTIRKNAMPLLRQIRKCHPETPILLVESSVTDASYFPQSDLTSGNRQTNIRQQNSELKTVFNQAKSEGISRIYYLEADKMLGDDHEATVDGVHPSDLGMIRLAGAIQVRIEEILKIK
ncbi:MAG: SGNH/GDSL hydrolase family protein [Bacteroidales bacterium]|nr:SGNH/GDSL hydrolase family protein [Bacteroidales bacterium]